MMRFLLITFLLIPLLSFSQSSSTYTEDSLQAISFYRAGMNAFLAEDFESIQSNMESCYNIIEHMMNERYDSTLFYLMCESKFKIGMGYLWIADQHEHAIPLFHQVLQLIEDKFGKDHFLAMKCITKLGAAYLETGSYLKAKEYCHEALALREKNLDKNDLYLAHGYANVGWFYLTMGDYAQFKYYFNKSDRIKKYLYHLYRDYNQGKNDGKELARLTHTDSDPVKELTYLNNVPVYYIITLYPTIDNYIKVGELSKAKADLDEVAMLLEEHPDLSSIVYDYYHLYQGEYYLKTNKAEASRHYQKILESSYSFIRELAKVGLMIAEESYDETAVEYSDLGIRYPADAILIKIINYLFEYQKIDVVDQYLEMFLDLHHLDSKDIKDIGSLKTEDFTLVQIQALREYIGYKIMLYDYMYQADQNETLLLGALTYIDKFEQISRFISNNFLDIESKVESVKLYRQFCESAINCLYQLNGHTPSDQLVFKALSISDRQKAVILNSTLRNNDKYIDKQNDQFIKLLDSKRILDKITYDLVEIELDSSRISEKQFLLDQQEKEKRNYDMIFESLRDEYGPIVLTGEGLNLPEIQNFSKENKVDLIVYYVGAKNDYVFIINDQNVNFRSIKKDLQAEVEDYITLLKDKNSSKEQITDRSRRIYQAIVQEEIALSRYNNIMVIPDSYLNYLPLGSLLTEEPTTDDNFRSLEYLIKKKNIAYNFSLETLLKDYKSGHESKGNYFGIAPEYSSMIVPSSLDSLSYIEAFNNERELGPIHFNVDEVTRSNSLFNGEIHIGTKANESVFKEKISEADIVHIAGHGIANDQYPEYSKIIFSNDDDLNDGMLHAYEIEKMKMNARLAILSACNTGFGKYKEGEGIMSLARAFKYAGCNNVTMSLWNANDYSSSEIITHYLAEIKNGQPKSTALHNAKLTFLANVEDEQFTHPFYWTLLIHIGDNKPMKFPGNSKPYLLLLIPILIWGIYRVIVVNR